VQQIESLTFTCLLIYVNQMDMPDDLTGLQSESCTGSDQTTTADDTDFHADLPRDHGRTQDQSLEWFDAFTQRIPPRSRDSGDSCVT
jgi:hypothetical protein